MRGGQNYTQNDGSRGRGFVGTDKGGEIRRGVGADEGGGGKSRIIMGIDEVGRGPWAGPLVIGAVILPAEEAEWMGELTDSKKLTAKKREKLAPLIFREAQAATLGWVSARELDQVGLAEALRIATRRAVKQMHGVSFTEIIIDGTANFLAGTALEGRVSVLKKADLLIREVSAASIIAKVARDQYMQELAEVYPGYGFEKHVGYGTTQHRAALEAMGATAEHRRSFRPVREAILRNGGENNERMETSREMAACSDGNINGLSYRGVGAGAGKIGGIADDGDNSSNSNGETGESGDVVKNTTASGNRAEEVVAEYLEGEGHAILARNHKTPFYEIDIISSWGEKIYFTEVKYRRDAGHGSPLEAITREKQGRMRYAAEAFMKYTGCELQPVLAVAGVAGEEFLMEEWFELGE